MKILTTGIMAMLIAAPAAFAQSEGDSVESNTLEATNRASEMDMTDPALLIRTRDITGGPVYTMEPADDQGWDPGFMYEEVNADWNQVGTIEDLVLSLDGELIGIVAEVGGFLDIGDKHVMLGIENLNLVAVDDVTYSYVTRHTEEELMEMTDLDEGFWN
jgi:hypothetical protein